MENKYLYFFALVRAARSVGLYIKKDDLVSAMTAGRTTHLSDLRDNELAALEERLRQHIKRQLLRGTLACRRLPVAAVCPRGIP